LLWGEPGRVCFGFCGFWVGGEQFFLLCYHRLSSLLLPAVLLYYYRLFFSVPPAFLLCSRLSLNGSWEIGRFVRPPLHGDFRQTHNHALGGKARADAEPNSI